jgi:hypothetical protein
MTRLLHYRGTLKKKTAGGVFQDGLSTRAPDALCRPALKDLNVKTHAFKQSCATRTRKVVNSLHADARNGSRSWCNGWSQPAASPGMWRRNLKASIAPIMIDTA